MSLCVLHHCFMSRLSWLWCRRFTCRSCFSSIHFLMKWFHIEGFSGNPADWEMLSIHSDPVLIRSASLGLSIIHTWAAFPSRGKKARFCWVASCVSLSANGIRFPPATSPQTPSVNSLPLRQTPEDSVRAAAANFVHKCYLLQDPSFWKLLYFFLFSSKCWMTSVISRAFWPWVAEQSGAAGPPWQPRGLEATDRSVAWCSWQTGLPSGPRHPGRPSLPSKFKCAPSHKCIMGTRIPRLRTYQALSLRLWAPEHTGNCGHPVGTSCFQFVGRTRVDLLHFYCFFLLLPKTITVSS